MPDQTPSLVLKTDLPFPAFTRGKVRDVYDLGNELLIVTSDRISAFDVVLPCGIPNKGEVLTQISALWFERTAGIVPNHLLAYGPDALPETLQGDLSLHWRTSRVRRTEPILVECVARGYLSGSLWSAYRKAVPSEGKVEVWGFDLPAGLKESEALPEPIFTPTTKAAVGHDESITFSQMADQIGRELAEELRRLTLELYTSGDHHARQHGFVIADTKVEFGMLDGKVMLIDELLTPDSSRFWDISTYHPGRSQPSYDKQPVRDYLQGLCDDGKWNKEPPGPVLPDDVVKATTHRYVTVFERLFGRKLRTA
jgi:phosphoribosylaminoimidazole-succinocarboxamide synthase